MKRMSVRGSFWIVAALTAGLAGTSMAKEGFSDKVVTLKDGLKEMLQAEGAAKLVKLQVTPTAEQKAAIEKRCSIDPSGSYTFYQGQKADGSLVGTVSVIDQAGKEGPLQLLIALHPDGTVYDAAFTVFGEERGKPALSWRYLKQYVGKNPGSPLTLGKDVDAVSGATMTSTAVAKAFKRAVCVYSEAVQKKG